MAKRKTRQRSSGRGPGRPPGSSGLKGASLAALQAEINRRLDDLRRRRDELAAELEMINQAIGDGGGSPVRRGPGRPRGSGRRGPGRPPGSGKRGRRGGRGQNATNLVDSLRTVLTGKTMSVTDVSQAVQDAGYKTSSANFRTIVNQALISNPDVFKKVARGQYTAK